LPDHCGIRPATRRIVKKKSNFRCLNIEPKEDHLKRSFCALMDAALWSMQFTKALAEELSLLRLSRGLSMNEVSTRSGLARSFITYLEQGRAKPSAESLARIGFALGISPGELLKRAERKCPPIPRFRKDALKRPRSRDDAR
jgi:DNA-binding Xre family transcriptional regulator